MRMSRSCICRIDLSVGIVIIQKNQARGIYRSRVTIWISLAISWIKHASVSVRMDRSCIFIREMHLRALLNDVQMAVQWNGNARFMRAVFTLDQDVVGRENLLKMTRMKAL